MVFGEWYDRGGRGNVHKLDLFVACVSNGFNSFGLIGCELVSQGVELNPNIFKVGVGTHVPGVRQEVRSDQGKGASCSGGFQEVASVVHNVSGEREELNKNPEGILTVTTHLCVPLNGSCSHEIGS
ncbi:MAG: hypothetical protein MUC43_08980, partial [Pirellula sp.]|nr:hypothetical protein [Pirellula sp.]